MSARVRGFHAISGTYGDVCGKCVAWKQGQPEDMDPFGCTERGGETKQTAGPPACDATHGEGNTVNTRRGADGTEWTAQLKRRGVAWMAQRRWCGRQTERPARTRRSGPAAQYGSAVRAGGTGMDGDETGMRNASAAAVILPRPCRAWPGGRVYRTIAL